MSMDIYQENMKAKIVSFVTTFVVYIVNEMTKHFYIKDLNLLSFAVI